MPQNVSIFLHSFLGLFNMRIILQYNRNAYIIFIFHLTFYNKYDSLF